MFLCYHQFPIAINTNNAISGTAVESDMSGEVHTNYFKELNIGPAGTNQIIRKGIAYLNVLMYSMHMFKSSIGKCVEGASFNQKNTVHTWDEGVVNYIGNLAGSN